jgi:perosamine synthetase|tara:strand:- start:6767 stop:7948 length:1182 start_codon:yes stop_codon:yes gene_type:complete
VKNNNNSIFPYRKLFGKKQLVAVKKVFERSWKLKQDHGYNDYYENIYTNQFVSFLKTKGYADAVNSGTSALFAILNSLNIDKKKRIALVSPVTNPGSITPLALLDFKIEIIDSKKDSFNISLNYLEKKLIKTKAKVLVITHYGGVPINLKKIRNICDKKKITLIEDCSQSHGAKINGTQVGTLGHFSFFSTMYRKNLATGGIGGIYFTKKRSQFYKVKSHTDRGKPYDQKSFNNRDFHKYKFPALNLNLDEVSCAVGSTILKELPSIIKKRYQIATKLNQFFLKYSKIFTLQAIPEKSIPSYYFLTIEINCNKKKRARIIELLKQTGIGFNEKHRELVYEWKWIRKYTTKKFTSVNALDYREKTINLYFNEKYSKKDVNLLLKKFLLVEKKVN